MTQALHVLVGGMQGHVRLCRGYKQHHTALFLVVLCQDSLMPI